MPAVKTSSATHGKSFSASRTVGLGYLGSTSQPGLKGFSPYTTTTQYHSSPLDPSPSVKIRAPYIDGDYSSPDYVPYGDWYQGPLGKAFFFVLGTSSSHSIRPSGYQQCPQSLSSETGAVYGSFTLTSKHIAPLTMFFFTDESLDNALFSWPYDDCNGYDPSFSFLADSSPTSTVSYSPRSDCSGKSSSLLAT